jgi:phosphatidylserine/phosphatidylglycerophosphate/cardiolipin synthase-like enzyme
MNAPLDKLGINHLSSLAAALRSGRLSPPYSVLAIKRWVSHDAAQDTADLFQELSSQGFGAAQIAVLLELFIDDRRNNVSVDHSVDLVTSGPESGGTANRDTAVVVRELFSSANESVLVIGYAVYQGKRVFEALAERMETVPKLKVKLFLDIKRGLRDTTQSSDIVRRFAANFCKDQWPSGYRLPDIYYFPASLEESQQKRAALHAKCVIIDCEKVFLGSANFTEAAQERNIELGMLLTSQVIAGKITRMFECMLEEGILQSVI